jgi:N-acetylated-alpha-linked acidic dipeptidase
MKISRMFLDPRGLPERPWFKNLVYAPDAYSGYGANPFPSIRDYMEQKQWREADAQIPSVARVIGNAAVGIDRAADRLQAAIAVMR